MYKLVHIFFSAYPFSLCLIGKSSQKYPFPLSFIFLLFFVNVRTILISTSIVSCMSQSIHISLLILSFLTLSSLVFVQHLFQKSIFTALRLDLFLLLISHTSALWVPMFSNIDLYSLFFFVYSGYYFVSTSFCICNFEANIL